MRGAIVSVYYDTEAGKRAANLGVNGDLPDKARARGINLPATFGRALAEALNAVRGEQWPAENRSHGSLQRTRRSDRRIQRRPAELLMAQFAVYRNANQATRRCCSTCRAA